MTTTQWELVEEQPDYSVSISAEGRAKLAAEQRTQSNDRLRTEIRLGAICGALIVIAGLVITKLMGI